MEPYPTLRLIFALALMMIVARSGLAATVRHYYIAAEEVQWDYAPSGRDLLHDRPVPAPWTGKTKFLKSRYIEYTDGTFSKRKPQPEWLGILGPIIRAEVGDTILVHFINRTNMPHSIHPHGLRYDKHSEGAHYSPAGGGAMVPPTGTFTYRWIADAGSGPGPADPSSKVWVYHPHVDEPQETNAGLVGPIIVTAKGKAKADGSPKDVIHEFVALFMIFDESQRTPGLVRHVPNDQNLFHAINGYIFGNLPAFVARQGDRVRWHLLGMGNENDLHTPHWHGKTVTYASRHTDVVELLPASMVTVDMIADNPGTWLFHCQVSDHMEAGMMATYTIQRPKRSCPIQHVSGDFWRAPGRFSVRVRNTSQKTIRELYLEAEYFIRIGNLRPFLADWKLGKPLPPGQEMVLEQEAKLYRGTELLGWVLLPRRVVFSDGSEWTPREEGECHTIFWRDKEHPKITVLPPVQFDVGEPD